VLTRVELIESARKRGVTVTVRTLQFWASQGLIPKPEIKRLGRLKGSEIRYTPETVNQVVTLSRCLKNKNDLIHARWELWVKGFPVDPLPVLRKALADLESFQNEISKQAGTFEDNVYQSMENVERERLNGLLALARKRVGKKRFPGFLLLLLETHIESDNIESDDEQKIFDDGLSFFLESKVTENVYTVIKGVGAHLDPYNLDEILSDVTPDELKTAFDELIQVVAFAYSIFTVLKMTFEGKGPNNRVLKNFAEQMPMLLLIWLSMRKDNHLYSGYEGIKKTIETLSLDMIEKETLTEGI
jgi:hypothetical protein